MRYLITFGYDGTKFHGFQRQNNVKNVQGTIERILSNLLNERIEIRGSGRTDAGVHAIAQTAHFDVNKELDVSRLKNLLEKEDIVLKNISKVDDNFHARFDVQKKIYCYKINLGKFDESLIGYVYQPRKDLDVNSMKEASMAFFGVHDFRNFVSGSRNNYETYIESIEFETKDNILHMTFTGAGFYRYMIRNLVGALYDVGRGKISKKDIQKMLDEFEIRRQLSTVPAEGLYLVKIEYKKKNVIG